MRRHSLPDPPVSPSDGLRTPKRYSFAAIGQSPNKWGVMKQRAKSIFSKPTLGVVLSSDDCQVKELDDDRKESMLGTGVMRRLNTFARFSSPSRDSFDGPNSPSMESEGQIEHGHSRKPSLSQSPFRPRDTWSRSMGQKWRNWVRRGSHRYSSDALSQLDPAVLERTLRMFVTDTQLQDANSETFRSSRLFEHFVVIGPDPSCSEDCFTDVRYHPLNFTLTPTVLYKYPEDKEIEIPELPGFCFPNGITSHAVNLQNLEGDDLRSVLHSYSASQGQPYMFMLASAGGPTIYGICMTVCELVTRLPSFCERRHDAPLSSPYTLLAPRCYCLLTHQPFFPLHTAVLRDIIAHENPPGFPLPRYHTSSSQRGVVASALQQHHPQLTHKKRSYTDCSQGSRGSELDSAAVAAFLEGRTGKASDPVDPEASGKEGAAAFETTAETPPTEDSPCPPSPAAVAAADAHNAAKGTPAETPAPGEDVPLGGVGPCVDGNELVGDLGDTEGLSPPHVSMEAIAQEIEAQKDGTCNPLLSQSTCDNPLAPRFSSPRAGSESPAPIVTDFFDSDVDSLVDGVEYVPATPEKQAEYHRSVEHLLNTFYMQSMPERGEQMEVVAFCRTLNYRRPLPPDEEAAALAEWTFKSLFQLLSVDTILTVLGFVLLEKQVLFLSNNLSALSSIVLAISPLIRPFKWQSMHVPILPVSMLRFLDAPVPFIAGVQYVSMEYLERATQGEVLVVDVEADRCTMPLIAADLPKIPDARTLQRELRKHTPNVYLRPNVPDRYNTPLTPEGREALQEISSTLSWYFEQYFGTLQAFCLKNLSDPQAPVAMFMKESFLSTLDPRDVPFFEAFCQTQMFTVHTKISV
eukprot:Rmarinus@m.19811